MDFLLITIVSLVVLGIVAALMSRGGGDDMVNTADGCAGCTGKADCKLADLMEKRNEKCHTKSPLTDKE